MAEPKIADTKPAVLELEPGTYFWCTCGGSATQPFCDGSHRGSEFRPRQLVIEEAKRVALCQCKRTGDQPFCDGTHKNL
jgi:CDGSH-type Zn-finger protein